MLFLLVIIAIVGFVVFLGGNQNKSAVKPMGCNRCIECTVAKIDIDYDNLPYSDALMVRFCRVENKEFICAGINRLEKTAVFRSRAYSSCCYHTTLNKCTCPDYTTPCKHMLYLADSLGYLEKWKRGLPLERYNNVVKTYNNCQYGKDLEGWTRDNTGTNNWHPGRTRIGGCW